MSTCRKLFCLSTRGTHERKGTMNCRLRIGQCATFWDRIVPNALFTYSVDGQRADFTYAQPLLCGHPSDMPTGGFPACVSLGFVHRYHHSGRVQTRQVAYDKKAHLYWPTSQPLNRRTCHVRPPHGHQQCLNCEEAGTVTGSETRTT